MHRLLASEDETFYCKGDNSFRVERIIFDDIIGKVSMVKRNNRLIHIAEVSECFICASYTIGKLFEHFKGDVEQVKCTQEFQLADRCRRHLAAPQCFSDVLDAAHGYTSEVHFDKRLLHAAFAAAVAFNDQRTRP